MDAKDLMIGCLVKTNSNSWYDESLKDKICKVEHIGHNYLSCSLIEDPERQPYGEDKSFDPIPLTAEILEKNGFVCKGAWCLEGEDMGLKQIGDSWALLPYYADYNSFRFTIISYIHELQHALRLCGIEKEIII